MATTSSSSREAAAVAANAGGAGQGGQAPPPPPAASYFGDTARLYGGPHFLVNSIPTAAAAGSSRSTANSGLLSTSLRPGTSPVALEDGVLARDPAPGSAPVLSTSTRRSVFWPELLTDSNGAWRIGPGAGVEGVNIGSRLSDEELARITHLYKESPPAEVRATTTLQCLVNLKKNSVRLVAVDPPGTAAFASASATSSTATHSVTDPVSVAASSPSPSSPLADAVSPALANANAEGANLTSAASVDGATPPQPLSSKDSVSPSPQQLPKQQKATPASGLAAAKGRGFRLMFNFDASTPCVVRVHWVAKEIVIERKDGTRQLAYVGKPRIASALSAPTDPTGASGASRMMRIFGPFPPGLHQKFELPDDCLVSLLDPSHFSEEELSIPDVSTAIDDGVPDDADEYEDVRITTALATNASGTTPGHLASGIAALDINSGDSGAVHRNTRPIINNDAANSAPVTSSNSSRPAPRRQEIEKGAGNPFSSLFKGTGQRTPTSVVYYPLIIELLSIAPTDKNLSNFAEPGTQMVCTQSTYATMVPSKDGNSFDVKIIKQKVVIDGVVYTLQDIFGFTDPTGTGALEPAKATSVEAQEEQQLMHTSACVVTARRSYGFRDGTEEQTLALVLGQDLRNAQFVDKRLNHDSVRLATAAALSLRSSVQRISSFDRKHYFYQDLPAGYQLTQQFEPIARGGFLDLLELDGLPKSKRVRIQQLQLEQDSGKLIHDSERGALVDLNRAGIGVLEIVTAPDLASGEEAAVFLKKIQRVLNYVNVCAPDSEEGAWRCDVNVSVSQEGSAELGVRTELKHISKFSAVKEAIDAEVARQIDILSRGDLVIQETRGFDDKTGVSRTLRSKEDVADYRTIPDPDIPLLIINEEYVSSVNAILPEPLDERRARLLSQYRLSKYNVDVLMDEPGAVEFVEQVANGRSVNMVVTWVTTNLFGQLKARNIKLSSCPVDPVRFGKLLDLLHDNSLSALRGKDVLARMIDGDGRLPYDIAVQHSFLQQNDKGTAAELLDKLISENPDLVKKIKAGKHRLMKFFLGEVMKESKGRLNPVMVDQLLKEKLGI